MIELREVFCSYTHGEQSVPALENLSLSVPDGSFTAILGANGSGKTTLAKLLNALILPDAGVVSVDGTLSDDTTRTKIRCTAGMVFQNPENQIIGDTVEDDIAFGPENLGLGTEEIGKRVEEAISLTGLENLRYRNPQTLSGGQMQRLAIAGVLAMKPKYIILDESLCMLDSQSGDEILAKLEQLNREQGLGIILITHDIRECAYADYMYVLSKGKVVLEGQAWELASETEKLGALGVRC